MLIAPASIHACVPRCTYLPTYVTNMDNNQTIVKSTILIMENRKPRMVVICAACSSDPKKVVLRGNERQ